MHSVTRVAKPSSAPPAAFVELVAPQACQRIIEVEGPRGRMRIEWKGAGQPDLASLSRMLWEPGRVIQIAPQTGFSKNAKNPLTFFGYARRPAKMFSGSSSHPFRRVR